MKLRLSPLILLIATTCLAQSAPDTAWTRTYRTGDEDWAQIIMSVSGGRFMLAGNTESYKAGKSDFVLMEVDANGKSLWLHTYGGSDEDILSGACMTPDHGALLAGFTLSYTAAQPADTIWTPYLVRTDSVGNEVWSQRYPTQAGGTAYDAVALDDGNFVVAGRVGVAPNGLDASLMKIDGKGSVIWRRQYGGKNWDEAAALRKTQDGGFVIGGRTYSYGNGKFDFYVIRTNADGDTLWTRTFGNKDDERVYDVLVTRDGGYVVAGDHESAGRPNESAYLVRLNSSGDSLWTATFATKRGGCARSVVELNDGSLVIAGYSGAAAKPESDVYLAEFDKSGKLIWEKSYGGSKWDVAESLIQAPDGGFALVGATKSYHATGTDFFLVKTKPE